jgi:sulfatase maturation enzyme AslB (radical SAM superfamily)
VQVSLDGDEAMHDAIRGPDSYRKAVRTLRKLVEHGIRCSVSTTVVDIDFMARADTFIAARWTRSDWPTLPSNGRLMRAERRVVST